MDRNGGARWWFGLTAAAAGLGVTISVAVAANATGGYFTTMLGRIFNVFCFFTIQSNLIVGVAAIAVALDGWLTRVRSLAAGAKPSSAR